jgi:hypothetical protein
LGGSPQRFCVFRELFFGLETVPKRPRDGKAFVAGPWTSHFRNAP